MERNKINITQLLLLVTKYIAENNEGSEKVLEGKTLLMKILYFLNKKINLEINFSPYFYGPYSPEVSNGIEDLKAMGLLKEEIKFYKEDWGTDFEPKLYRYQMSDFAADVVPIIEQEFPDISSNTKKVIANILNLSKGKSKILSISAKMYHILDIEERPMTKEEILKEAIHFKWNIDSEEADAAINILQKINLIE